MISVLIIQGRAPASRPTRVKRLKGVATAEDPVHRKFHWLSRDELWVTAVTDRLTRAVEVCCLTALNVVSRKVVGNAIDSKQYATLVASATDKALRTRTKVIVFGLSNDVRLRSPPLKTAKVRKRLAAKAARPVRASAHVLNPRFSKLFQPLYTGTLAMIGRRVPANHRERKRALQLRVQLCSPQQRLVRRVAPQYPRPRSSRFRILPEALARMIAAAKPRHSDWAPRSSDFSRYALGTNLPRSLRRTHYFLRHLESISSVWGPNARFRDKY